MRTYEQKLQKLFLHAKKKGLRKKDVITPFEKFLISLGVKIKPLVFWSLWETLIFNFILLNVLAITFLERGSLNRFQFLLMLFPFIVFGVLCGQIAHYFTVRVKQKKLGVKWSDL